MLSYASLDLDKLIGALFGMFCELGRSIMTTGEVCVCVCVCVCVVDASHRAQELSSTASVIPSARGKKEASERGSVREREREKDSERETAKERETERDGCGQVLNRRG